MTPSKYGWISGITVLQCGFSYKLFGTILYGPNPIIKWISVFLIVLWIVSTGVFITETTTRSVFSKKYGVKLHTWQIKVKGRKEQASRNYYVLEYPRWQFSKKDGTADRRHRNNGVFWKVSSLTVDNYLITSKRPYYVVRLVQELRKNGTKVEPCKEEIEKYNTLESAKQVYGEKASIQSIIAYYEKEPTGFELYCAELFRKMGYVAEVTPPTNDGGYDIKLKKGGKSAIVECKCYAIEHSVGRPMVQKLVGANSVTKADQMIFITTSTFSTGAVSYAMEANVILIDGAKLLKLLKEYGIVEKENIEITDAEWQLEVSDLRRYVPADIYAEYFL